MVSPLTKPLYDGRAVIDDPYVTDWLEAVMVSGAGATVNVWVAPVCATYEPDCAVEAVNEHWPAPTNNTTKPDTPQTEGVDVAIEGAPSPGVWLTVAVKD